MNKKTMATLMALSMIAVGFAFAPSATAEPCSTTDSDGDGTKDKGTTSGCDAHYLVAGPASFRFKGIFSVGISLCHNVDPTLALACLNTGGVSGAGGHDHPTTDCTGTEFCLYNIWARPATGFGNGGFGLVVCTDRDDNGDCTNVTDDVDDFGLDGSTGGTVVAGSAKNEKNGYASLTFCVRKDVPVFADPTITTAPGDYDNFNFFVYAWADESVVFPNANDNTGVGVHVGQFDVWVVKKADSSDPLDQPACDALLSTKGTDNDDIS